MKKKRALRSSAMSLVGTVVAAIWLFWEGGHPGWLVPIGLFGGILVLAGASQWAVLQVRQEAIDRREPERARTLLWFGALGAVTLFLFASSGATASELAAGIPA